MECGEDQQRRRTVEQPCEQGTVEPCERSGGAAPASMPPVVTTPRGMWRARVYVIGFVLVFILTVVVSHIPTKPYPACDDGRAMGELRKLYDNRRLLHVAEIRAVNHVRDRSFARDCSALVKWSDGSQRLVRYAFERENASKYGGSKNEYIIMWTKYNGGMWGPAWK